MDEDFEFFNLNPTPTQIRGYMEEERRKAFAKGYAEGKTYFIKAQEAKKKHTMNTPQTAEGRVMMNTKSGWLPSIPEPFYAGFRKKCHCGQSFWRYETYQVHYIMRHVYGFIAPRFSRF